MSLIELFEDRGALALPSAETRPIKHDPALEDEVSQGRQRWREVVQKILAMDANLEPPDGV